MSDRNVILCGVEEPIRPNRYRRSFDPATDEYSEDDIMVPELNRYSFVFHGDTDVVAAETKIARFVIQLYQPAYWICAWETPRGVKMSPQGLPDGVNEIHEIPPLFLRWMEQTTRKRQEQGWNFCTNSAAPFISRPTLQVAWLTARESEVHGFAPLDYHDPLIRRRIILVTGLVSSPCMLVPERLAAEIAFMSRMGHFTPSQSFLQWLATANIGVVFASPSMDLSGVVVLSSRSFTEEELRNMGATDVRVGEQAETVWHERQSL